MIDFHSHILPGMDDGPAEVGESLQILKTLADDGVETVVATPHLYFFRDTVESFLERRARTADVLFEAIEKSGEPETFPRILIGAEVYYTEGLISQPLEKLCIENTDQLLLELPYMSFTSFFINRLANFADACEVNIILAHIERYYNYSGKEEVERINQLGLTAQGNCDSLLSVGSRALTLKLIKRGVISLIGTDVHNMSDRPPNFKTARDIIRRKLSAETFDALMQNAAEILGIDN